MLQIPQKSNTFAQSGVRERLFSRIDSESARISETYNLRCINNHRHAPICRIEGMISFDNGRRKSIISSVSSLVNLYSDPPVEQKFKQEKMERSFLNLDFTWVLGNADINLTLLCCLFGMFLLVRYLSFVCTIYYMVSIDNNIWQIFCLLGVTSLLYCACMIKTSLKPAETSTQIVLKTAFNSLDDSNSLRIFQIVSKPRLFKCFLRGIVPPQLSFIFIQSSDPFRRKRIYLMINYIYCSIEAVIYIPGYLIYYYMAYQEQYNQNIDLAFFIINLLVFTTWVGFLFFNCYLFFLANKDQHLRVISKIK